MACDRRVEGGSHSCPTYIVVAAMYTVVSKHYF